jgi:hypothetical protein
MRLCSDDRVLTDQSKNLQRWWDHLSKSCMLKGLALLSLKCWIRAQTIVLTQIKIPTSVNWLIWQAAILKVLNNRVVNYIHTRSDASATRVVSFSRVQALIAGSFLASLNLTTRRADKITTRCYSSLMILSHLSVCTRSRLKETSAVHSLRTKASRAGILLDNKP